MGFKDVFKSTLPFLTAAIPLPPPFGQLAANAIGKVFGADGATPDKIDSIIAANSKDPELLSKLKQAEDAFAVQMQQAGFDQVDKLLGIDSADRANARAREIAVKDRTPMVLAFTVTALAVAAEGYVLIHGLGALTTDAAVIVGRVLGTIDSALMVVLTYYFGSSAGSAAKTDQLAKLAAK